MAKQRGLHQIKGKVGEYSYYSQTGVSGGLIRKINEGLSARVKSDAAYANTRLNNREFGAAADTASLLGKTVVPKFRPMILPFSQSKMAREVLKVAREGSAAWGQRVVTSADTAKLCAILTAQSKRDAQEFVSVRIVRNSATDADAEVSYTAEQGALMESLGITHLTVTAASFDIATGQWVPLAQEMTTGYMNSVDRVSVFENSAVDSANGKSDSATLNVDQFIPESGHAGHQIVVFLIMPIRQIASTSHILQEYCSFIAMPLPAA